MTITRQFRRRFLSASLALGLVAAWTPAAAAQDQTTPERKNSVYLEMGGSSYWATVNYERMLSSRINVRVGGGAIPGDFQPAGYDLTIGGPDLPTVGVFVAGSSLVFGSGRHHLTAGIAMHAEWNRVNPNEPSDAVYFGGEAGYRYCSRSGFLLKTTVAVMTGKETTWVLPSVSLGWSF